MSVSKKITLFFVLFFGFLSNSYCTDVVAVIVELTSAEEQRSMGITVEHDRSARCFEGMSTLSFNVPILFNDSKIGQSFVFLTTRAGNQAMAVPVQAQHDTSDSSSLTYSVCFHDVLVDNLFLEALYFSAKDLHLYTIRVFPPNQ